MALFAHGIFADVGPELDRAGRRRAVHAAHRSAYEAQETFTLTARRQYRRYRQAAGAEFMAWPEWHTHYLAKYRGYVARNAGTEYGND